jgi:CRP/FNR family transcriptional regulator, dissimilatory nitrate respiration regulator
MTTIRTVIPRGLAAEVPAALRALGQPLSYPEDGWVFRKGDAVRAVFLVIEGEVRLSRFAKDGSEIALHRAGRGEFFAEAALNTPRYHCNAIANQPTTLLAFPADKVRALLADDAGFAREWIALLARQLHNARARLERVALNSAAERVLHYLNTEGRGPQCEVLLAGTVKDLARELGLTHETLYRTLARLERDGVVAREDGRLRLT